MRRWTSWRIMEGSSKLVSGHYQVALPWRKQPHWQTTESLHLKDYSWWRSFFVMPNFLKATRGLLTTTSQRATPNEYIKKSWMPMANLSGIFHTMPSSILISLGNWEWCLTAQRDTKGHRSRTNCEVVQTCLIADDLLSESVEYGMRVHLFGRSCASPPRRESRRIREA